MTARTCSILLSLTLFVLPLQAGVNRWTPFGPGSQAVGDLALSRGNPATLFAVADEIQFPYPNSTVFRSVDGGASWTWWGRGLETDVFKVAVDPLDPQTLYAISSHLDLFRSIDGGRTWSKVQSYGGYDEHLSVNVVGGILYIAGERGVFVSHDGGENWTHTFAGEALSLVVHPDVPDTLYLGSQDGVWKSTDGGFTWSRSLRFDQPWFESLAIAPSNPSVVYAASRHKLFATEDGGKHWSYRSRFLYNNGLAVDAGSPNRLYAARSSGLWVSADGGRTWSVTSEHDANVVVTDPDRPGTAYAAGIRSGLNISRNGGLSWFTPMHAGLGVGSVNVFSVDKADPQAFYLCRADDCLRSRSGGQVWKPVYRPSSSWKPRTHNQPLVLDVAFDPQNPDRVYAVTSGEGIYRVEYDGTIWHRLPLGGMNGSRTSFLNTVVVTDLVLLAGGRGGGFQSEDEGLTWTRVLPWNADPSQGVHREVQRFLDAPADPGVFYALAWEHDEAEGVDRRVVYGSRNRGRTWSLILQGSSVLAVDPTSHGTVYSVQGDQFLRSRDRGTTWTSLAALPTSKVSDLAVDPEQPSRLLASTRDLGVLRSEDGGRTWIPFNAGPRWPGILDIRRLVADPAGAGRFFALPTAGGVFEITVE